jgi:hypothetical protein
MSRQYIIANYSISEKFIIPKGLDLNNKSLVEYYTVKWNTLYIKLRNDEKLIEVQAEGWIHDFDYKFADTIEEVAEEEAEEEEEEDEEGKTDVETITDN